MRKKVVKDNSKVFCSNNWENGVTFSDLKKTTGRVVWGGNIEKYVSEKFEKHIRDLCHWKKESGSREEV